MCTVIKRKPPARGNGIVRAVKGWVEKQAVSWSNREGTGPGRWTDTHVVWVSFCISSGSWADAKLAISYRKVLLALALGMPGLS